ncbi:hypothetical protein HPB50_017217 [Hyalomma asiaticum]|uniref:Uncharacterized protein n=1 Tax=Hyalomma asiaticum TaxID=266040 RepID=A0ACB7TED0_HYAAI|nr:hypothetical protein HPB50_017217 [Hyalomma asiaticum]
MWFPQRTARRGVTKRRRPSAHRTRLRSRQSAVDHDWYPNWGSGAHQRKTSKRKSSELGGVAKLAGYASFTATPATHGREVLTAVVKRHIPVV